MNALLEAVGRHLLTGAVVDHPLGERPAATQRIVEFGVRQAVLLGVALGDTDVEIRLDLVDEPDILTRELATGTRQRAQVSADEIGTPLFQIAARVQFAQQPVGLTGEFGGLRSRLVGHRTPQFGVSGEGVDIAFLDPVEAQPER